MSASPPEERFIGDDAWGQVFVIGGGSSGFEERIKVRDRVSMTKVKCIANGKAYAVGTRRTVFRRDNANQWVQLT